MPVRRAPVSVAVPSQSQLAMTGARLCVRFGISPREAAKHLGDVVSHQSIRVARELLSTEDAATIAAIEQGTATVHGAEFRRRKRVTRTVGISNEQYKRLRAMSERTGVAMQHLTATALETYLALCERAGGTVSVTPSR